MIYKETKLIKEPISAVGIGCWNFGGDWDDVTDDTCIRIVHAAVEQGINLFDVAPIYGFNHAETVLGRALKTGLRDKVLIASKCGLVWDANRNVRKDLSAKSITQEIDASLRRLGTDYIDIYQLHWPDHSTPLEETAGVLQALKQAGKIRYVGLSNFAQADAERFMEIMPYECQQGLYNMLERNARTYHDNDLEYRTEDETFETVRKYGQAFLPFSPYMQGLLMGRLTRERKFSKRDIRNTNPKFFGALFERYFGCYRQLEAFGQKIGRPASEICVNWLRQREEVTCIIGGVSSVAEVEGNVHALTWEITPEQMSEINRIIEPFREA